EAAFAAELYMSRDQIRGLASSVGAHSYAHEPLALLPPDELDRDLERCTTLLEEITGVRSRAFSYPHGTASTVAVGTARRPGAAESSSATSPASAASIPACARCATERDRSPSSSASPSSSTS